MRITLGDLEERINRSILADDAAHVAVAVQQRKPQGG